jgi:hypothetical protein
MSSAFPYLLTYCPGDVCDPCKPGYAWPAPYLPNLKISYSRYPGLALWNYNDYIGMVEALATSAGSYVTTGTYSGGSVTRTTTLSYSLTSDGNTWFLKTTDRFSPDPPPAKFPPDIKWTVSGSYQYIGFQYANGQYVAVLLTDSVTSFL